VYSTGNLSVQQTSERGVREKMKQLKHTVLFACFALLVASFLPGCGNEEMTAEAPPAEVMVPEPGEAETLREVEKERTYEKEMIERSEEREDL